MKDTRKTNNTKQEEKKESKSVYLRGVLIGCMFGKRTFTKGGDKEDKFRLTIKPEYDDMITLRHEAELFYEDTDEQWIPKWMSSDNVEDLEFLNLSSNYDIKLGQKDESGNLVDLGTLIKYTEENGNINGSKVVLLVTLKQGAIYPQGVLIKELKKQDITDMFAAYADDLPF